MCLESYLCDPFGKERNILGFDIWSEGSANGDEEMEESDDDDVVDDDVEGEGEVGADAGTVPEETKELLFLAFACFVLS